MMKSAYEDAFQREKFVALTALPNDIPHEILVLLPAKIAFLYQALPLEMREDRLVLAIGDSTDLLTLDVLRSFLDNRVEFVSADPQQLQEALLQYYGNTEAIYPSQNKEKLRNHLKKQELTVTTQKEEEDAPIIKIVSALLLSAYECRASDVHLEPLSHCFRVRFRIDGVLQEVENLSHLLQAAIINRLKIMSGSMSIAEKRLPQDGHFRLQLKIRSIDFRVSIIPTIHGESAVIRILDKSSLSLGLSDLGFLKNDKIKLENLLHHSANGMVLITGPTGSGKTTTLYACLTSINKPDRKIITVEDPIEYQIPGINQVQINSEIGMIFPTVLRSILRQAPNILMIGEIRDVETAQIAIHASLTGHLIFSTLHTNDATSAIARLVDIGIPPFLISSSLKAIIAQRLVRKLCPSCKKSTKLSQYELHLLNIEADYSGEPMAAVGCSVCQGKGYKGRMGIFEIFILDEESCLLINQSASPLQLRRYARGAGMKTLSEDGICKVLAGITTAQEVIGNLIC